VVTSVVPPRAVGRGRVTINGSNFDIGESCEVLLRDVPARISFASSRRIVITIPDEMDGGRAPVLLGDTTLGHVSIGSIWATGLHQVDNPVFDRGGNLFVTYSGSRGQESPVSIFRVTPGGTREPFSSGIVNATSMAIGPDGKLYVSSRFEGAVYRVAADGTPEQVASDLGVACGIAFDDEGWMFVGDRSGTIFRVRDGRASAFAMLPASVAAFHLAMSPAGELHVTAPTLGTYDPIYKIDTRGQITTIASSLGRPQGIAFGPDGKLYVVDALAGSSGLHRLEADGSFTPVVAGGTLVGVAFGPNGELVVASNETAYRFD
jgi:DNA-binding beta-propeller fold protein YncE